jgi:ribosomal protein S6--L-glutamate ligase
MEFLLLSENPSLYSTKRLLDEASTLGLITRWENPYKSHILLGNSFAQKKILVAHRTTGIRFDDYDLLYAKKLSQQGAKIFNHPDQIQMFRNKDKQSLLFQDFGLPTIPSLVGRGPLPENFEEMILKEFSPHLKNERFILKMIRGNKGIGVNLIHGIKELQSWWETFHALQDQKLLIQPFLENYKEIRVFVIGNKIIGGIEKLQLNDSFKQNLSISEEGIFLKYEDISEAIINNSKKVIKHSKLDYFALDFLANKKNCFPLEINLNPGFEYFEKISKINLAKAIIESQKEYFYEN